MTRRNPPLLLALVLALLALAAPARAETMRIVALGDSLSAGFQLPADAAFPARLEKALRARGHDVEVANAGVSGDTATGGLARLDWAVPEGTDAVILELGANDMLRGIDPQVTRRALTQILERLKARGIEVLIAGMHATPSLGPDYVQAFDAIYPELAARHGALLYPFFLEGVAMDPALNLPDRLHPNARGVDRIVERILPHVEALIARVREQGSARPAPAGAASGRS